MLGHGRQRQQGLGQRAALLVDGAAGVVDHVVRLLAADVGRHAHHHGLGDDQPPGDAEVVGHARHVDDQPAQRELRLMQRAGRQDETLGNGDPLGVPRAGGAFEVLHHRIDHQPGMLAHRLRGGEHQFARNRVALLRHGAAGAPALDEGLVDLGELGGRHDHDVERDLAQRAGDQRQQVHRFGKAVARHVPGGGGHAQAQFLGQRLLHGEALVAQRRQRAGGPGELHHGHARAQFGQTLLVAVEHRQPDRHLVAKGDRQGLLQVGAAGHRGVAVPGGQVGQNAAQGADIGVDAVQRVAHLEGHGGVHDVLRGGAPVDVPAGVAAHFHELVYQREDRIADNVGFLAHVVEVDAVEARGAGDGLGGIGRNHADAGFGPGKGDLDVDVALD
ncbi:hypothetical protein D3C86_1376860 [compost metagenome]